MEGEAPGTIFHEGGQHKKPNHNYGHRPILNIFF